MYFQKKILDDVGARQEASPRKPVRQFLEETGIKVVYTAVTKLPFLKPYTFSVVQKVKQADCVVRQQCFVTGSVKQSKSIVDSFCR